MNIHRALPLTVVAIASAGAYLTSMGRQQPLPELAASASATSQQAVSSLSALHARNHNDVALQDMTLHAFRHFNDLNTVQPDPGVCLNWTPNWELRWLDFHSSDGHVARVYHATSRHHPGLRFTINEDSSDAQGQAWERAQ